MRVLTILLLLPNLLFAQTQRMDSVVVTNNNGETIRYVQTYYTADYENGDSLIGRNTSSRKRTLVSPLLLPISNAAQNALNLKATIATTDSMRGNIYNAINGKQNTITVLPFANGGIGGGAATSATTGTISVSMTTEIITCTPTGAMTLNATGGVAGQRVTFIFTTSGVNSFVITFGTGFVKVGTLATGTTSARRFTVSFIFDGVSWIETGRTAAQT